MSTHQQESVAVNLPLVSALICTRNRGESLLAAVKSILHPNSVCCELIIIDQSDNDRTRQALQPFFADTRLKYVPSTTQGKGAALNMGLKMACGEIVAITDDDCEVSLHWPRYLVEAMVKHRNVAVSYGNVIAGEHDSTLGFVPEYHVTRSRLCRNIWEKLPARGIGANTAVRRDFILAVGGFDTEVGPGGKFRGGIDRDMTLRCMLAGFHVFESHDSTVLHYGFRNWEQGRELTYSAWYGMGASAVKPLKGGRWDALPVGVYEFTCNALFPFLGNMLRFKRPTGWLRVRGFIDGITTGMKTPIERDTLVYVSRQKTQTTQEETSQKIA